MKKNLLLIGVTTFLAVVLWNGCSTQIEDTVEVSAKKPDVKSTSVSLDYARYIATNYDMSYKKLPVTRSVLTEDQLASAFTVNTEDGEAGFHAVNYNDGGFMLVSADNRIEPILAYVEEGTFPTDLDSLPPNVHCWADNMLSQISALDQMEELQTEELQTETVIIAALWNGISPAPALTRLPPSDPSDPDCEYEGQEHWESIITGGYSSNWTQGSPFNANAPNLSCPNNNGKALLGCATIAAALAMRSQGKPTSYNWSSIPVITTSPNATHTAFLRSVADQLMVSWGCSSTSSTIDKVREVLKSNGINNVKLTTNINNVSVQDQISAGRVVIVRGSNSSGEGHQWLITGFESIYHYKCLYDPYSNNLNNIPLIKILQSVMISTYYLVWGWGTDYNGWFYLGNYTGNKAFNSDRKYLYDIY